MTPRWYVRLAVVASGAGCLAIEILGARLLGPFYGNSLYLWSSLIGLTLGALSLGYALGGLWADRGPRLDRFSALLAAAGIWIAASAWLRRPILEVTEAMGLRGAVLTASAIMFFPPLAMLGMAIPYAVRLRTASLEVVGRAAGELYALSTVASVGAALLTGFVLVPLVGPSRLAFQTGAALFMISMIGLALMKTRRIPAAVLICAAGAAAVFGAPRERTDRPEGLVAITESPYAEIRVVDFDDLRIMLLDGMIQTEVDALTLESRAPYVDVLELAQGFYQAPGTMLLVGLGGGSLARRYAAAGWRVDAAEIDPAVTRTAYEYFGLTPADARVYAADGREFLREHAGSYDLIILDAFGAGGSIPFHLVTREAFAECKERLAPGGVVALNVIAVGWRDKLVRSVAATLEREFSRVVVLPMAEPPDQLGNVIIFAANRDLALNPEPPPPHDRFSSEYTRAHAWDNRFAIDPAPEQVITDDRNPADLWAEHINYAVRKSLHEYFASRRIDW